MVQLINFNTILRVIGFIIVIPSVPGIIVAIIMFISTDNVTTEHKNRKFKMCGLCL